MYCRTLSRQRLAVSVLLLALAASSMARGEERRCNSVGSGAGGSSAVYLERHGWKRLAAREPAAASDLFAAAVTAEPSQVAAATLAELVLASAPASPRALERAVGALRALQPFTVDDLASPAPDPCLSTLHERVLQRVVTALDEGAAESPSDVPRALDVGGTVVELRWSAAALASPWGPRSHRLVPAGEFDHSRFATQATGSGIGARFVAIRREGIPQVVQPAGGWFPSYEYFYPVTVLAEMIQPAAADPRAASLELRIVDPREEPRVVVDGRDLPLAFDLTAQVAAALDEVGVGKRAGKGLRRAAALLPESGLYLPEPFRPGSIPVVFVHGLKSSPATWMAPYNTLVADARIRERFQFWFFNYPSGLPFSYSAHLPREALTRTVAEFGHGLAGSALDRMILVGHSMGGLLARTQVTASGGAAWAALFTRPPEELDITAADAALVRSVYFFEPQPFVARVVFVATPHRGSALASSVVGRIGSSLVAVPPALTAVAQRIIAANTAFLTPAAQERLRIPDSIETLSPDDPVVHALDTLPVLVPFHSIVGDRGRGDGVDGSDGAVPYRSSHLDGAESELVVPAGHNAHQHPAAIEELRRILLAAARRSDLSAGTVRRCRG